MAINIYYDKDCDLSLIKSKKSPSSALAHKDTRTQKTYATAALALSSGLKRVEKVGRKRLQKVLK